MLFTSPLFLFVFLPFFFLVYSALPSWGKNGFILLASLIFYAWGEPAFVFIAIISAVFDWLLGRFISDSKNAFYKKAWLWLGIMLNVSLLFYFKYSSFFVNNFAAVVNTISGAPKFDTIAALALPIGISFIVFEKITYLVDIARDTGKPASSLLSYLLYVFLFPKLLAGPIIKYHDIALQLDRHRPRLSDVEQGFVRFVAGVAKKVLLADCLAGTADVIFASGAPSVGTLNAWFGILCFTLQIYFDFSGYSDMAIGLARMMGFRLRENFNMPYIATSFTDFWHRWHLSLSSWIREYLYIPLGGNRISPVRTYVNLVICFLLCGIWHGASWTFVVWGIYHGAGLIVDKLFWLKAQRGLPTLLNQCITLFFIVIGWVFFRSESLSGALGYLRVMFTPTPSSQFVMVGNDVLFTFVAATIFSFVSPGQILKRLAKVGARIGSFDALRACRIVGIPALLLICVARSAAGSFHPFLYFRF